MLSIKLVVVAFFALFGSSFADNDNIILEPPANTKSLPEKLLVFIPGGGVATEFYKSTAQAIQLQASRHLRLWVVIPSIPGEKCILICPPTPSLCGVLQSTVDGQVQEAVSQGYKGSVSTPDVFLMGHSLGGICSSTLARRTLNTTSEYKALIVAGAYVDNYDVGAYPLPVLTLGAELDGGSARAGVINKILSNSDQATVDAHQDLNGAWQLTNVPVTLIPGISHSNFCPGFPVPGDVPKSDVSNEAAVKLIGENVAAFLFLHSGLDASANKYGMNVMTASSRTTRDLLAPYNAALALEVSEDLTTADWCKRVQHHLAGLSQVDDKRLDIEKAVFKVSAGDFEGTRVSYEPKDGKLILGISGRNMHYLGIDLAENCVMGAQEIGCKMVSADRIAEQLNITDYEKDRTCGEMNRVAYDTAISILEKSRTGMTTLERFKQRGRPIYFEKDFTVLGNVGPLWINTAMTVKDNSTGLIVASSRLGPNALDSSIFPGCHYCKVLSPARIMDFIYTDGLKPSSGCLNI